MVYAYAWALEGLRHVCFGSLSNKQAGASSIYLEPQGTCPDISSPLQADRSAVLDSLRSQVQEEHLSPERGSHQVPEPYTISDDDPNMVYGS